MLRGKQKSQKFHSHEDILSFFFLNEMNSNELFFIVIIEVRLHQTHGYKQSAMYRCSLLVSSVTIPPPPVGAALLCSAGG